MKDHVEVQQAVRRKALAALTEIAEQHWALEVGGGEDIALAVGMATAAYRVIANVAGREAAIFGFGQALMEPWFSLADRKDAEA
jgi:hypothetical protein